MDRARWRELARDIAQAGAAGDWQAVAAADVAIKAVLGATSVRAAAGGAERSALLALREAHDSASRDCAHAAAAAGAHMAAMQASREGWLAYALDSDTNLDGTPA